MHVLRIISAKVAETRRLHNTTFVVLSEAHEKT